MTARWRGRLAVVLAVALAALPVRAEAYLKFGVELGGQLVPVRWSAGPIRYFVTERDIPGVSAQAFADAIARSAATWDALPELPVSFSAQGFTRSQPLEVDGRSTLGFLDRLRPGTGARRGNVPARFDHRRAARVGHLLQHALSSGRRPRPARPAASTWSRWRCTRSATCSGSATRQSARPS